MCFASNRAVLRGGRRDSCVGYNSRLHRSIASRGLPQQCRTLWIFEREERLWSVVKTERAPTPVSRHDPRPLCDIFVHISGQVRPSLHWIPLWTTVSVLRHCHLGLSVFLFIAC